MTVRFYGKKHKDESYARLQSLRYCKFSNYSEFQIEGRNIMKILDLDFTPPDMKTIEHLFQASKYFYRFKDSSLYRNFVIDISKCESPRAAQKLANLSYEGYNLIAFGNIKTNDLVDFYSKHELEPDPNFDAVDVMERIVTFKFRSCKNHSRLLKSTGVKKIIEFTPYDLFWGQDIKGEGENRLGNILMKIRDQLGSSPRDQIGSSSQSLSTS